MKDRKKITILLIVLSAAAFLLTLHPKSVAMRFAGGPDEPFYDWFRYWSLVPMGYGNWGPIITGICTVLSAVLAAVQLITGKAKLYRWIRNCGIAAVIGNTISLLLFGTMTIFGIGVLILMAAVTAFAHTAIE